MYLVKSVTDVLSLIQYGLSNPSINRTVESGVSLGYTPFLPPAIPALAGIKQQ